MNALKDYHLILIDGSSYIYRAFYALPPMNNAKGKPTSIVFGVVNMVRKLIKQYPNSHIAVVFDAPGKNFRHKMYADYKANRPKMPDEIREQIKPLHQIIKALGLNLLSVSGVEADDVLGTLAHHYADTLNQQVLISSGDKDMAQLVNTKISVVDTMKNITFDEKMVQKKFGVKPNQIIDYLALVGDSSDNIPGVPKVGAKTAQKWLAEYESVASIISNAAQFKGRVGELLRENIEQLKLSYKLATIDIHMPLKEIGSDIAKTQLLETLKMNENALLELYQEMSFHSWIIADKKGVIQSLDQLYFKQLNIQKNHQENKSDRQQNHRAREKIENESSLKIIKNSDKLKEFIEKSRENAKYWSISWLSNNHNSAYKIEKFPAEIKPIALMIDDSNNQALIHFDPDSISAQQTLEALSESLLDESFLKLSFQGKFDVHLLSRFGKEIKNLVDVSILAWLIDSNGKHDLENLAQKYLQKVIPNFLELAEKKEFNALSSAQISELLKCYCDNTILLYQSLVKIIDSKAEVNTSSDSNDSSFKTKFNYLWQLENKSLLVLAKMEAEGVLLDTKALFNQGVQLKKQIEKLKEKAFQLADEEFNLASPLQVAHILYEKLKLPISSKTPAGKPSTAESALEETSQYHPIAEIILAYRLLNKLVTTYIDALPVKINPKTKRIHTTYNQTGTITGRLSSTEPNLQNIPIRSNEGKKIRKAFVAPKDFVLLRADYSQIELRLMADFSADETLIAAFNQDLDIHRATASEVFGLEFKKITSDLRRKAKAVNFGLIYGISPFGLARQLKVSQKEAKSYMDAYFSRYPKVLEFMQNQKEEAKKKGFVESILARRIYLPDIYSRNFSKRAHSERMAINAPLQASASDIIKKAMVEIDDWLTNFQPNNSGKAIKIILQIHDELVFEVHKDIEKSAKTKIQAIMENTYQLKVPLIVNLSSAKNLAEIE